MSHYTVTLTFHGRKDMEEECDRFFAKAFDPWGDVMALMMSIRNGNSSLFNGGNVNSVTREYTGTKQVWP